MMARPSHHDGPYPKRIRVRPPSPPLPWLVGASIPDDVLDDGSAGDPDGLLPNLRDVPGKWFHVFFTTAS